MLNTPSRIVADQHTAIGMAARLDDADAQRVTRMLTTVGPDGMLIDIPVEPMGVEPVTNGFLKLHRVTETGAPSGTVWVQADKIAYMHRETWADAFTRLWLIGDCHVRCAETPEQIIEALGR